jgi:hypothetical protein
VDLQTLRNIKDCLHGEKVPLKKLMQIHNETTAVKAKDQAPQPEQNEHEAAPSTKSKAEKNAKRNKRRRKPQLSAVTHTIPGWTLYFAAPNQPPLSDPHTDLEAAATLIDEALNSDQLSLEDLWTYLQVKRMADELITRKKRSRTAKIHIQTHEQLCQSGNPYLPPSVIPETHHAHLTTHFDPSSHSNPNRVTQSPSISHKGMSPPQPRTMTCKKIVHHRKLYITFYPTPHITLSTARQTPRGRGDGPRRTGRKKAMPNPNIPKSSTKEEDKCLFLKTKNKYDYHTVTKLIQIFLNTIYHLHPFTVS